MFPIPPLFKTRITHQLFNHSLFFEDLDLIPQTSIRLHPQKKALASKFSIPERKVPWNSLGFLLPERPAYVLDPFYHAGLYYPMEAASMFLEHLLKNTFDASKEYDVLDLCAAPGGKTLILNDYFERALLVSNEIESSRTHVLKENAIRWGTENHLVIRSDAHKLQQSKLLFDIVLVDAPCSGEGLFRKDPKSRAEWSAEKATGCALRQKQILNEAIKLLKPGGHLIYSTCTYNPEENMAQLLTLKHEHHFSSLAVPIPNEWKVEELCEDNCFGYQFWPHQSLGEGFFIGVMKAPESDAINSFSHRTKNTQSHRFPFLKEFAFNEHIIQQFDQKFFAFTERELQFTTTLLKHGTILKKGIYLGETKGNDFIPSYDFAMNTRSHLYPHQLALSREDALKYLQGHALNTSAQKGVILLTFEGLPIGFGKSNGSRINNLFPKHLRIN